MHNVNHLLEQTSAASSGKSTTSWTEAGPSDQPGAGAEAERGEEHQPDHVDAINQVFGAFRFAYHNQFHKAFPTGSSLAAAKKYWQGSLERYSPAQIIQAARQVISNEEYLPSIAVMLKACERRGHSAFGLPAPRQAYGEACRASSPKRAWAWSHPAVYQAGKAAGWDLLANESEAKAFPVFEYHYDFFCRRVINGDKLDVEPPPPIPEQAGPDLDKAELRRRIGKLKKELGLR